MKTVKMMVALCLLGVSPVRAEDCFNLSKVLLSMKSDAQATETFDELRGLMAEFFYVKGYMGPEMPLSIPWETARELARFLERKDFDVRVREDLYQEERESLFSAAIGATAVIGFMAGYYSPAGLKEMIKKFISKKLAIGAGFMGSIGVVGSSWFGGEHIFPEGSCDLVFSRSIAGRDAIPLSNLGTEELSKLQEPFISGFEQIANEVEERHENDDLMEEAQP